MNHLKLGKMVATANGAKAGGMRTATNAVAFHQVIHVALPRLIDGTKALDAFVNCMTSCRDIGAGKIHAATDITPNQIRIHEVPSMESGANRTALPHMKVGHAEYTFHSGEFGRVLELFSCLMIDPGPL
jgi:hypothetical protein